MLTSEIRLCFAFRHDLSNLSAAFEWAAANDNWVRAADLLNGVFSAYELFGRILEGLSLVRRSVEHVESSSPDLADHLLAQSLSALASVDDFALAQRHAIKLAESTIPCIRVVATAFHGWAVSYSRPDRSAELLARSQRELDAARSESPGPNSELAAGMLACWRAGNRCVAFDYVGALADAEEAMAIEAQLGFRSAPGSVTGAVTIASMCLVLLGRSRDALQLLGQQDQDLVRAIQVANGDQVRVFALLELGELDDARERVRRMALRGLARRYAYEANDCVVMLAGLADAEGDAATATELVLSSGTGSGWGVVVADNLAMRLDVTEQRHRRVIESIRSRNTSHNTQQAAQALRKEVERRGWTPSFG